MRPFPAFLACSVGPTTLPQRSCTKQTRRKSTFVVEEVMPLLCTPTMEIELRIPLSCPTTVWSWRRRRRESKFAFYVHLIVAPACPAHIAAGLATIALAVILWVSFYYSKDQGPKEKGSQDISSIVVTLILESRLRSQFLVLLQLGNSDFYISITGLIASSKALTITALAAEMLYHSNQIRATKTYSNLLSAT
jgi:hypothetical protein